ncbi:MAG: polyprenyl synthetase family protein [Candidatus Poribacteria bacterium]|nr:polyprenyl synthetase family protein [Candidatus Poribacteria bacterium]
MDHLDFNSITKIIVDDLEAIERILLEETRIHYDFVDDAVRHVIEGGGKRLRPVLLILSSKACGYTGEDAHILAACIELIHVASLVHDDVLDEAPIRRSQVTLHSRWGNKVAVLVGDYLHARVLSMLASRGSDDPALEILANAAQAMCEGEVIHAYKNGDFEICQNNYLKIVELKTGKLISASCHTGAILGTKNPEYVNALIAYGELIGIAFQIIDDLLDFVADPEKFGKQPFKDLREGKLTFPMIYVRENCTGEERKKLEDIFNAVEFAGDQTIEWMSQLLDSYAVKSYCLEVAQEYVDRAQIALNVLPNTDAKVALNDLAESLVSRDS